MRASCDGVFCPIPAAVPSIFNTIVRQACRSSAAVCWPMTSCLGRVHSCSRTYVAHNTAQHGESQRCSDSSGQISVCTIVNVAGLRGDCCGGRPPTTRMPAAAAVAVAVSANSGALVAPQWTQCSTRVPHQPGADGSSTERGDDERLIRLTGMNSKPLVRMQTLHVFFGESWSLCNHACHGNRYNITPGPTHFDLSGESGNRPPGI